MSASPKISAELLRHIADKIESGAWRVENCELTTSARNRVPTDRTERFDLKVSGVSR
jgi:hypothetical protein